MKQTGYGLWGAVAILGVFVICQQIQLVKVRTKVEQLRASNEAMLASQKSAPVITVGDATKKSCIVASFQLSRTRNTPISIALWDRP
jgi:hypothetical protein